MDWVLYFTMIERNKNAFYCIDDDIVEFRLQEESKTSTADRYSFLNNKIRFLQSHSYARMFDALLFCRR